MKKTNIFKIIFAMTLFFSSKGFCYSEDEVKAAFIYNFTKFVSWPLKKEDQIIFCIYGAAKDKAPYRALEAKENLEVRDVYNISNAHDCSIIYKKASGISTKELSIFSVKNSILLVGDGDDFVNDNGMIGLVLNEGKISFEVNYLKIKEANLKISSKLMALAKRVVSN